MRQWRGRPDDGARDRRRPVADAVLVAACAVARAAVAAYNAAGEQDEERGEFLSPCFERGRLALECVAVTSANTARGVPAKATLLADYAAATDGSEPSHEMVRVTFSLAADTCQTHDRRRCAARVER
jgi:hypothetical protein